MKSSAFQEESRRDSLQGDRDCSLNGSERNECLSEHKKTYTRSKNLEKELTPNA